MDGPVAVLHWLIYGKHPRVSEQSTPEKEKKRSGKELCNGGGCQGVEI